MSVYQIHLLGACATHRNNQVTRKTQIKTQPSRRGQNPPKWRGFWCSKITSKKKLTFLTSLEIPSALRLLAQWLSHLHVAMIVLGDDRTICTRRLTVVFDVRHQRRASRPIQGNSTRIIQVSIRDPYSLGLLTHVLNVVRPPWHPPLAHLLRRWLEP